jgi:amidohydrolase
MHSIQDQKYSIETLTSIRQHLHAHPEIADQESETAAYIIEQLKACHPAKIITRLGGFGVAAVFDSGRAGKTLLFRAELDALPIQELSQRPYRSKREGCAHSCGHDGHMAVLLGLAGYLAGHPLPKGRVILLFQPAEETGTGAAAVLADPQFRELQPDAAYAFHNLPGFPANEIVVTKNAFTAAVKSMIIQLQGKTAHAAEPENGSNPALAIAEILMQSAQLSNNFREHRDFKLITPIHIHMGGPFYGTSAGAGEVHFTIRTWQEDSMDDLIQQITGIAEEAAERSGLKVHFSYLQEFAANKNHPEKSALVREVAGEAGFQIMEKEWPFKWGEDFGRITQLWPGSQFGIGAGEDQPALHNPDYDFPDEILSTGVEMFVRILQKELP